MKRDICKRYCFSRGAALRRLWKSSFLELLKSHRKTPVTVCLFDKVAGFQPATSVKKRPRHRSFYDIFSNTFFIEALGVTASGSSSQAVCLDIILKISNWYQYWNNIFYYNANFENVFFSVEITLKPTSRLSSQGKYLRWSPAVVKPLSLCFTFALQVC